MTCRLGWVLVAAFILDQPIARLMARLGPGVEHVFTVITWFGQGGVILYPAGGAVLAGLALGLAQPRLRSWLRPWVASAATVFVVVAGAGLVNDVLKIVFGRARPRLWLAGDGSGFEFFRYGAKWASFPSGHTATSVAAAIVFSSLFPRWRLAFAGFAILIAASRVLLDVHYVSDVVAGAAVGSIVALAILKEMRQRDCMSTRAQQESKSAVVAAKGTK